MQVIDVKIQNEKNLIGHKTIEIFIKKMLSFIYIIFNFCARRGRWADFEIISLFYTRLTQEKIQGGPERACT